MARSKNINTYSVAERAMLTPQFLDSLPQLIGGFPTRAAAMGARMGVYGLIGAARASGTELERQHSYSLAVSMPVCADDGTWGFYLSDRDALDESSVGASTYAAAIAAAVQKAGVTVDDVPRRTSTASQFPSPATPTAATANYDSPVGVDSEGQIQLAKLGMKLTPMPASTIGEYAIDKPTASKKQLPEQLTDEALAANPTLRALIEAAEARMQPASSTPQRTVPGAYAPPLANTGDTTNTEDSQQ